MTLLIKLAAFIFPLLLLTDRENIKKEILALNKRYVTLRSFDLDVNTKAYDAATGKLLSRVRVHAVQKNSCYFTEDGTTESMANFNYKISIHHGKRFIAISKLASKSPDKSAEDLTTITNPAYSLMMDTILDFYKNVSLNTLDINNNELAFFFKKGKFDEIKLTYNKTNYNVTQVETHAHANKKEYRYLITYDYRDTEKIKKSLFDESNYFKLKKGKIVLNERFAGYKLIYNK